MPEAPSRRAATGGQSPVKNRYLWLLIALVFMLVIAPLLHQLTLGFLFQHGFLMAVFVTGVMANRHRRRLFLASLIIASVTAPLVWAAALLDNVPLSLTTYVLQVVFLGMMAVLILISVIRDVQSGHEAIFGAICVYLLMGLAWAIVYAGIEFVESEPFAIAYRDVGTRLADQRELTSYTQMVYFSFVTMSTLGYGDMVPITPLARTATWMQSVAGQLYIAVLVARLVSALPAHKEDF